MCECCGASDYDLVPCKCSFFICEGCGNCRNCCECSSNYEDDDE